jgi:hypothetical protein
MGWAGLLNIYSEIMELQKYSVTRGERALGPFAIMKLVRQHANVRHLQTAPGTDSVLNLPALCAEKSYAFFIFLLFVRPIGKQI